jgi:hypothetical protein
MQLISVRPPLSRTVSFLAALLCLTAADAQAQNYKELVDVPNYGWYAGCFGTASGNLAGFWDRHGLPDFYTGPTGGGVAPLNTVGANSNIRSMWTSKAGIDGRPANLPGHIDDYYSSGDGNVYDQSTATDPYALAGRPEHAADCIGDFIGLNQKKWTNMAGECDGNIDAYSFVFWDKTGNRRWNHSQTNSGQYVPDIQSGLKAWARHRGYDADVFTQLPYFSPEKTTAAPGFTYADMKAEIDAGNPVLLFLQPKTNDFSANGFFRSLPGMTKANPAIHGVMVFGYIESPESDLPNGILIRTSWALPGINYEDFSDRGLAILGDYRIRGVIGFRPKPKVTRLTRSNGNITIDWDGPSSQVRDGNTGVITTPQRYQVERTTTLSPAKFFPVGSLTSARTLAIPDIGQAFYRVSLVP